jgi:hypothetical protein
MMEKEKKTLNIDLKDSVDHLFSNKIVRTVLIAGAVIAGFYVLSESFKGMSAMVNNFKSMRSAFKS